MARARKFIAYRFLKRSYTRYSKYNEKSFVKVRPVCRVVRFDMGTENKAFTHKVSLVSKSPLQVRDLALESARQTSNRLLEKSLPKSEYRFKVMAYPHHILRENPLASGAGADRMSTGMAHSFGKPIGVAAQIKQGKTIFRLEVNQTNVGLARKALHRASTKLPCSCSILVEKVA
ncbi:50S ribosomal protein L16 [Candidatus Woesearchaeota archaeon]|nr:50S ribosomal protein L16 [Candidatus Woesearchaeota archaeon]